MGLVSSLALALIPLARRFGDPSSPPTRTTTEELIDAVATLKRELTQARTERAEARADAERWESLARSWEARCRREAERPMLERQQALYFAAAAQAQCSQMNAQMAQQAMGQNYLNVQNMLYGDCTCVPGRAALLRGDH